MLRKFVLIVMAVAMIAARSSFVFAVDAPAASDAAKASAAAEANKLSDLEAFGNNMCKQLLAGSTEVFKNMDFEFVIRLSTTPADLDALGKSVSELASDTLAISMANVDSPPPKAEKCEVLKKEVIPCTELYYMIAKSANVQEAFKDNDKLSETDRINRVTKAAKESGVTSCGLLHVKTKAKGESLMMETATAGIVGGKWRILEMISTEDKDKKDDKKD